MEDDELYAEAERRFPGDPQAQSRFMGMLTGDEAGSEGETLPTPTFDRNMLMRGIYDSMKTREQIAIDEAELRRRQYEQTAEMLRQQRVGPSRAEMLMNLSSAFLSPTPYRGFKGTMANVAPVMQQAMQARTTGGRERQQALMELMQNYQNMEMEARRTAADDTMGAYEAMGKLLPPQPRTAYDTDRGMFVSEGQPVREMKEDLEFADGRPPAYAYLIDGNLRYKTVYEGQEVWTDPEGNVIGPVGE